MFLKMEGMNQFLTFGLTAADPWRIVVSIQEPILLIIEFCQIQGPRPLYWHPNGGEEQQSYLLEDIAVWLMSSENMHANVCSLYNQQLGVYGFIRQIDYVLVQYATMLDVTARAFQRPFAVSLITPSQPSANDINNFQRTSLRLLLPILSCNRRYIYSAVRQSIQLMENGDQKNIQSYYSTSGNAQQIVIVSAKIKSIVQQTRSWFDRVTEKMCNEDGSPQEDECCCECNREEFQRIILLLSQKHSSELIPIMELAPCNTEKLKESAEEAYRNLTRAKGAIGLVFCGNFPILRSSFGANSELHIDDEDEDEGLSNEANIPYILAAKENTLKSLSHRLLRCVYPLLIGERILILASQQRCYTGIDLLTKMNSLSIYRRRKLVKWDFEAVNSNHLCVTDQIAGASCERAQTLQITEDPKYHHISVIDLNNYKMRSRAYVGRLLWQLAGKRNFPSDSSVLAFVASVVSDLHQIVQLSRYISPESVVNQMALTLSDQLILYNCLSEFNVTKYTQLGKKKREILDSMAYKKMEF